MGHSYRIRPASPQETFVVLARYGSLAPVKKGRLAAALPTPFDLSDVAGPLPKNPYDDYVL